MNDDLDGGILETGPADPGHDVSDLRDALGACRQALHAALERAWDLEVELAAARRTIKDLRRIDGGPT